MFLKYFFLFLWLLQSSITLAQNHNIIDVDFIKSMTDDNSIAEKIIKRHIKGIKIFQDHYDAKKPSKMLYNEVPLIPKVMHQIWLGEASIPPLYSHYLNECKELYPDWEFKFWGEKEIEELGLEYKDIYDKSRSYAGKSDIARYEILYRFGGVYRDMDVKCLRPIDDLNHKYDFFTSTDRPAKIWTNGNWDKIPINNGIIGSRANHPIFKTTLDTLRSKFDDELKKFDNSIVLKDFHVFAMHTSMSFLTDAFIENATLTDKSIVFPATYFFSLLNLRLKDPNSFIKTVHQILNKVPLPILHFLKPESLMMHNIRLDKREVTYCDFDYANHMGSTKIKNIIRNLQISHLKIYKIFKEVYKNKIPSVGPVTLSKVSKTPLMIHFIVFDNVELLKLRKNLPNWKILNGSYDVHIWDKSKITKAFKDIDFSDSYKLSENFRFYLALRILEKTGGSYAHFKAFPHQSIFELNNRYSFYAGLNPLVKLNQKISLSQKFLGAKQMHPIISKTLQQIDPKTSTSLEKINDVFVLETYKGIYLSGSNIVFPVAYFEPMVKIKNEPVIDKIIRFCTGKVKPFSTYTQYTIVQ